VRRGDLVAAARRTAVGAGPQREHRIRTVGAPPAIIVRAVPPPPFRATVERDGDRLVVTWVGDDPVAVHVSLSPDDPGDVPVSDARAGRVELDGLAADERHYVHLVQAGGDTVVAAERRVPLRGTMNFRDLGGYTGAGGRRVRWGRVFRSDHLGDLDAGDLDLIGRLGVRTVVDYQGAHERGDGPRPELPGARRVDRPIVDGPAAGVTFYDRVIDHTVTSFTSEDMAAFYLRTLEGSAATFGEVIGLIADPAHHAVVFHCRAGKDRTGLTAALLLGALGVPEDDILEDYDLTNRFRSARRVEEVRIELAGKGVDIDDFLPLFTASRPAMVTALRGLRERWGSFDNYLTGVAGLDASTLADLRRHLLI
jgi:protein-tyrosine phosphatase